VELIFDKEEVKNMQIQHFAIQVSDINKPFDFYTNLLVSRMAIPKIHEEL